MTTDSADNRWVKINALLDEALALPIEHRTAWLEALADHDQDLREVLRRLLEVQAGCDFTPSKEQPVDAPHRSGECIGHWRLLQEIGKGGMGAVWLAERSDSCNGAKVALKLPRAICGVGMLAGMQRERDILSALQHPHIAKLHEAGTDQRGQPYLALQHVEGSRIDVHCRRERLGLPARVALFLQIVDAVRHAHAQQIIHRDLKPSNVLIDARGEAMLLDFGIATLLHEFDIPLPGALTPRYASPEQLQGQRVTAASDIYSLGVMLHELLTGESPYVLTDSSPVEWTRCVLEGRLRRDLDKVVRKALARDPAARYGSAAAFAAALSVVF
jgi:serine/threonine-protein kinase